MADLFGRTSGSLKTPITSDQCTITFDGNEVAQAVQFTCEYTQSVTRRRSIGSKDIVMYGSQPQGRITIGRLITTDGTITEGASWTACGQGEITFSLGSCENAGSPGTAGASGGTKYTAIGCMVTSYSIQAQSEDLTVMDNVTIEFLELTKC